MAAAFRAAPAPLSGLIVADVIAGLLFARIFAGTDRPVFSDPVRAAGGAVTIPQVIPARMRGFAGRGGVAAEWS
jgi:hypothetical protein